MTYAPTSPTNAPLPVEHARAARKAGALGGALVGVGLPLALSPAVAWGLSALYAWIGSLPQAYDDGDLDVETREVFQHTLSLLSTPLAIVLAIVCALAGAGLVALGVRLAIGRLRRAGVHRAVGSVLLGLLLARVGTWLVGLALGGLPDGLVVSWFLPLLGLSFEHVYPTDGTPFGVVFILTSIVVVVVSLIVGAGTWLGIGLLTTWWMASALRQRVPAVAVQPWPAPTWSAEGRQTDVWPQAAPTAGTGERPAPRSQP